MKLFGGICSLIQVCIALGTVMNVCARFCPVFFGRGGVIVCMTKNNTKFTHYEHNYSKLTSQCKHNITSYLMTGLINIDCRMEDMPKRQDPMMYITELSFMTENPNSILQTNSLENFYNLERIILSGANIETIEPGAFDNTTNVKHLNLSRNQIETLPLDIFANMRKLTELDLSYNTMTNLSIGIFTNLYDLKILWLTNCSLESLDDLFLNLTGLKYLYLEHNKVKRLESNTFSGNILLTKLDVSFNEITYLSTDALPKNNSLRQLEMHHNRIKEISHGTFDSLNELWRLDLSWNEITAIEGEPFDSLNELWILDLSWNEITAIEGEPFKSNILLEQLRLSGNKLSRIACSEFSGLQSSLRELYIDSNSIKAVDRCAFKDLNLQTLNLDSNMLNALDTNGDIFGTILTLILSNNKLTDLTNVFLNSTITELDLGGNNLNLSNDMFAGLTELRLLSMKACNIAILPEGLFSSVSKLTHLYLDNNVIREIDLSENPFINLFSLDLSCNKIDRLDVSNLRTMYFLNISHNRIVNLEGSENLASLWEFDASSNFLSDFKLRSPVLRFMNVSYNRISSLKNLISDESVLDTFDISHNKLSSITHDQWKNILCIETFDARNNHIHELTIPEQLDCHLNRNDSSNNTQIRLQNNNVESIRLPEIIERSKKDPRTFPNIDFTLNVYLSNNPILCKCSAYNVYQYLKEFNISRHYINIRDKLTCHNPLKLRGKSLQDLQPTEFWCDYEDECVDRSLCTPAADCVSRCHCYFRAIDNVRIVDCRNKDYDDLPLYVPQNIELLFMDNNNLRSLAGLNRPVWQNLTEIHAEYNDVESENIPIPKKVTLLSLKGNKLKAFPAEIHVHAKSKSDFKVTLSENLWPCDCSALPLKAFLLQHTSRVIDIDNVTCSFPVSSVSSELISKKASDLCPRSMISTYASIAVAAIGLIIGICYCKYEIFILKFLYTECNWCYSKFCCNRKIKLIGATDKGTH